MNIRNAIQRLEQQLQDLAERVKHVEENIGTCDPPPAPDPHTSQAESDEDQD